VPPLPAESADGVVPPRAPCHVGIVTTDLDQAMEVLAERFGVTWRPPTTVEQAYRTAAGVVRWPLTVSHSSGPIAFELLAGGRGTVWATDALTALHHYAFWTTDLAGEVVALQHKRWELELTVAGDDEDGPHEYAYLVRPGSARLELISRPPR
jgi:hypothetical protein